MEAGALSMDARTLGLSNGRSCCRQLRLLPPFDPFLQARDRDVLLPDKSHRKVLWRGLPGAPGAVLIDNEIAGVWKARAKRRDEVDITVVAFRRTVSRRRSALEDEAARVAEVRGVGNVTVRYEQA